MSDDSEERRQHRRYKLWVPARIEGLQAKSRLAIGHDISQKGSLLVMREPRPKVGDALRISVRVPPDGSEERVLSARVVRCGDNDSDPHGLWPVRVAVEFDEASPDLEQLVEGYLQSAGEIPSRPSDVPPSIPPSKP